MAATVHERESGGFESLNLPHILMGFYRRSCAETISAVDVCTWLRPAYVIPLVLLVIGLK